MYFSSSLSQIVLVSCAEYERELSEAIKLGAPQCSVHFAANQEAAVKIMAQFQKSGTLPDFVLVDTLTVGSELGRVVETLRTLTQNACPVVLVKNGTSKISERCRAHSSIGRSAESLALAAQYWTSVNLPIPQNIGVRS